MLSSYHNHSFFSDGNGYLEDYLQQARGKGLHSLGMSDHSPVNYPAEDWTMPLSRLEEYVNKLEALKTAVDRRGDLELYSGLELDYIEEDAEGFFIDPLVKTLDYRIGSVHTLHDPSGDFYAIDGPEDQFLHLLNVTFGGKAEDLTGEYYRRVSSMIQLGGFEIVGHLDLIKKRNGDDLYFSQDSPRYRKQLLETLELIAAKGLIMEVNTGGISRGAIKEVYPSLWVLKEARKMNVPVQINADAHIPDHIDFYFKESVELLKEAGYSSQRQLKEGIWQDFPL